MFIMLPFFLSFQYGVLLLAAAVCPALFLMRYIYRLDKVEPEPSDLLFKLFRTGITAAFLSMVLEWVGEMVLNILPLSSNSAIYTILFAFLVVAAIEEGTKYFLMHKVVWNSPFFDFRFDGIVYSAFTSLGFAAIENVLYVFRYGLGTAVIRALLSVPGHLAFSVVFGTFYGRAKMFRNRGMEVESRMCLTIGYLLSVFLHGFYDACAMSDSSVASLVFDVFVIVMYVTIYRLVKREAKTDSPV
ncbi:MAG: PrsW family intramembrane metalloprotease [Lachnospiraceae bacterium]|nr:PrsW family intramembrane metalloprotease [Lachnospiraceae bacterium]